ncbi:MAG: tetratricopeptide repeat protein [Immundisolibacteraceae bacterium]|nr:tetratricopeptide repeat protein [Immundisolibacteraceae bacterium]
MSDAPIDGPNDAVVDFEQQVVEPSRTLPVLVDFWAEWCEPCKTLGPILDKLAEESDQWTLVKIDVDSNQPLAAEFGVRGIPAVMLFVDGVKVDEFSGVLPEGEVRTWLENHLPSASAAAMKDVTALLDAGDQPAAEKLLETLIDTDPQSLEPRIGLSRLRLFSDPSLAQAMVEGARLGDEQFDQVEAIRRLATLMLREPQSFDESKIRDQYLEAIAALKAGEVEVAIEGFIKTLMLDPGYDEEGARLAAVAAFNWLPGGEQQVRQYRRKMQRALN